jgi:hypothetical protein
VQLGQAKEDDTGQRREPLFLIVKPDIGDAIVFKAGPAMFGTPVKETDIVYVTKLCRTCRVLHPSL